MGGVHVIGKVAFVPLMFVAIVALFAAACGGSGSGGNASESPTGGESTPMGDAGGGADSDAVTPVATEEPGGDDMDSMDGPMDGPSDLPTSIEVMARDNVFNVQPSQGAFGTIEAPANTEFTVKLVNEGVLPHNIAFYNEQGGTLLDANANGDIILEAETDSVTFTTPDPGTYFFVCTVHPQEMLGDFIVN